MLNPKEFASFLTARAAKKDGYIMGAVGQNPKALSEWYYSGQYSGAQLEKARYWREHAERVWDCQGLADGYVSEATGVKVDVRARDNYSAWCGVKGEGKIPAERRVPGAAVFIHDGSYITHVGFLTEPVKAGEPAGDWYVVEARGVLYGVVTTKLNSRGWNRWGWMTKYFDYGESSDAPGIDRDAQPTLRKGSVGEAVAALQRDLISLGYSCGACGADGDFGSATLEAVKAFQRDSGLTVDGIVGEKTWAALNKRLPDNGEAGAPQEPAKTVRISAGVSWNVRVSPSAAARVLGYAMKGDAFAPSGQTAEGWIGILFGGESAWVSEKAVG